MSKVSPDITLDAALDFIAACDMMTICTAEPTSYAEATDHEGAGGYCLAEIPMTPGDGNGDYVIADDGLLTGRKLTMSAHLAVDILHSGTALHVALTLAAGTTLRYVTSCTSQALVDTGTVDQPAWKITFADPT